MPDRQDITQTLLDQLDCADWDLLTALEQWWYDPRPGSGLRLSDTGYQICTQHLGLTGYHYEIGKGILIPRNLLALNRYLTCPYYLRRQRGQHRLTLFGSSQAVMANLYGDIDRFIKSLED